MGTRLQTGFGSTARKDIIRFLDSYASLLVLILVNFFLLELVDDRRWVRSEARFSPRWR